MSRSIVVEYITLVRQRELLDKRIKELEPLLLGVDDPRIQVSKSTYEKWMPVRDILAKVPADVVFEALPLRVSLRKKPFAEWGIDPDELIESKTERVSVKVVDDAGSD